MRMVYFQTWWYDLVDYKISKWNIEKDLLLKTQVGAVESMVRRSEFHFES